jgi:plastocyanin
MKCAAWVCLLAMLCGCDQAGEKPKVVHANTSGPTGTIRGKVIFVGQAPKPRQIDNHACCPQAKPIFDSSLLVGDGGAVENAVVYVKGLSDDSPPPASQPVIDQQDCEYRPHLVAIRAGQSVIFKSSETGSVPHNVHIAALSKNLAIVGPGSLPPVKFENADFVNVRCDVHPWMSCWIAVMDGPWFATTDAAGTFEIKNVPAGPCTLAAWQERLSTLEQNVNVTAGQTTDVTFTYKVE